MNIEYYDYWQQPDYGDYEYMFWHIPTTCPYCNTVLEGIRCVSQEGIDAYNKWIEDIDESLISITPTRCPVCQWWQVVQKNVDHGWKSGHSRGWHTQAVLKSTDIGNDKIPTDELARYLRSNPDKVYDIHHRKMEELVAAILREQFDCEVTHCGRSHDRGIDLLMVRADESTPIQVKRRMTPDKTENVNVVRELMGVMLRDGFTNAMVVTTASAFTTEAKKDVAEVIKSGRARTFDLIDYHRFIAMLKDAYGEQTKTHLWGIPERMGGKGPFGH